MSRAPRRLQWGLPEAPPSKHPYRDTVLVYGALAVIVVLFAWVTGGAVGRAAVIAVLFFAVASVWSIVRLRTRARKDEQSTERVGEGGP